MCSGARQSGKTTFIRSVLEKREYLDLEKPSDLARVSQDPQDALERLGRQFILDEAQQLPELFPVLRSFVDENRNRKGQAVLLGSASPTLIERISESLAGRAGVLDITPFQWRELDQNEKRFTLDTLWFRGGFSERFPDQVQSRASGLVRWIHENLHRKRSGGARNQRNGVSDAKAVNDACPFPRQHLECFATGGVARCELPHGEPVHRYPGTDVSHPKLQPYYANVGKRLVKSPKIYLRDSGLLHYFLGIHDAKTLDVHPSRGASWEGFILEQVINGFSLTTPGARAFYWRTARGEEVDLLVVRGRRITPIEVKRHSAPRKEDAGGLITCMKDLKIPQGYILYPGDAAYSLGGGIEVLPARSVLGDYQALKKL